MSDDTGAWTAPPDGSTIRLMADDGVAVPLWSVDGLLFDDAQELRARFGVSAALAEDVVAWAADWPARSDMPSHHAEAAALVERLTDELGHRYRFVYTP